MDTIGSILLHGHFSTMEGPQVKCVSCMGAFLVCYPGREEQTPLHSTIKGHAALPWQAVTPGLFVHIRARFYSAHLNIKGSVCKMRLQPLLNSVAFLT